MLCWISCWICHCSSSFIVGPKSAAAMLITSVISCCCVEGAEVNWSATKSEILLAEARDLGLAFGLNLGAAGVEDGSGNGCDCVEELCDPRKSCQVSAVLSHFHLRSHRLHWAYRPVELPYRLNSGWVHRSGSSRVSSTGGTAL